MSDGATLEEALENVQQAIASWIESTRDWKPEIPVGRQSPASMETGIERCYV
jgi:predicted RNase H-like HicB family nuclease